MTTLLRLTALTAVIALLGCSINPDTQTGEAQVVSRVIYVDGMT